MDLLIGKKSRRNVGIIREYHNYLEGFKSNDMFTVSVIFRGQILYRYHKISQITPNYRYVGIKIFKNAKKPMLIDVKTTIDYSLWR